MRNFKIKVCGITRIADAEAAIRYGADILGFIFYDKSPRTVSPDEAQLIIADLDDNIITVGVFVNETQKTILQLSAKLNLDYVQLSGDEKEDEIKRLMEQGLKVIKSVHIRAESDIKKAVNCLADIVHFDNADKNNYGGSGQTFDWKLFDNQKLKPLMLAGGLNENNIAEAVKIFKPQIVDVNSGVEDTPGIKSEAKLKRFIEVCDRINDVE